MPKDNNIEKSLLPCVAFNLKPKIPYMIRKEAAASIITFEYEIILSTSGSHILSILHTSFPCRHRPSLAISIE